MTDDTTNVVKLRQPAVQPAAGVSVDKQIDEAITPRSFITMTELEQDTFLQHLRERRLRVVELQREANIAKQRITALATKLKLEKKNAQVDKQLDKTMKDLDKLEDLIYDLRTLVLQFTDVDIANVKTPDISA